MLVMTSRPRFWISGACISATCLLILFYNPHLPSNRPVTYLGPKMPVWMRPPDPSPSTNLTHSLFLPLTAYRDRLEDFAFTDGDGTSLPFRTIGEPAIQFKLWDEPPIDAKTEEPMKDMQGDAWNGAVLKLPRGSKWGFVGVARGPTRFWSTSELNNHQFAELCLIAFGLNMTSDGSLFAVSGAYELDLPQHGPRGVCGNWFVPYGTHGAEDPRLFWTDAGTPAMMFGRFSDQLDLCRTLGVVEDLRDLFPALNEAMVVADGAAARAPERPSGDHDNFELLRDHDTQLLRWLPFYPGATRNASQLHPHFHYSMDPDLSLRPVTTTHRHILYEDVPGLDDDARSCMSDYHPQWGRGAGALHQGTGMYRLTLCNRGCVPDEENTVLMGLAHTKVGWNKYGRFLVTLNVTSPFAPLSVGPKFSLNGLSDEHTNFVLTMNPIEAADLDPSESTTPLQSKLGLGHFFLDDKVLISLGHRDNSMYTLMTTVPELLAGHRLCHFELEDDDEEAPSESAVELGGRENQGKDNEDGEPREEAEYDN